MSDLDQLLTETFERRATTAPAGLSPDTVHRAIRRHQLRTAKLTAGAVALVVLAGAGLAAATQNNGHRVSPGGKATPTATASPWNPGTVLGGIAWQNGSTLSVRYGSGGGSEFEFCITSSNPGYSCHGPVTLSDTVLGDIQDEGGIYGIAPPGTASVTVSVSGRATSTALLVRLNLVQNGLPSTEPAGSMLYGAPGVTAKIGKNLLLTRDVEVRALDAHGKVLANRTETGSWDLAQTTPPAGTVGTLPSSYPSALASGRSFVWVSADHWMCIGGTDTLDGHLQYGAQSCSALFGADKVGLFQSASSAKTTTYVLQVPANVATAELRPSDGNVDGATITRSPYGDIAVVTEDSSHATQPEIFTARDASGKVVFTGPVSNLPQPAADSFVSSG